MTDLPQNLFSVFYKLDDQKEYPKIDVKEDLVIKIIECMNTTFYKTVEQPNQQNLLSVYASTASIAKAKYHLDLQVNDFLYLYGRYVGIMEKAVKDMKKANGSKVGMG